MATFEAWAQDALDGITWADHTYVRCPDNGKFFGCWSDSYKGVRKIVTGNGNYAVADCYRCPVLWFPDTACIGSYAVDGVCHQSANCFLFTANVTLNFNVRGYWLSLLLYGTYGKSFWRWVSLFNSCVRLHPTAAAKEVVVAGASDDPLPEKIRQLHASAHAKGAPPDGNEVLMDEAAMVTKHHVPGFDPGKIRGIHADILREKDDITASGLKGRPLADRLNELAARAQDKLAKRLTPEEYKTLMGVGPDQRLNIVENRLADVAGEPAPAKSEGNQ